MDIVKRCVSGNTSDAGFLRLGLIVAVCASAYWMMERRGEHRGAKVLALALALGLSHFQGFAFEHNQLPLMQGNMARYWQWQRIWKRVMCQTGWSYEYARERLYFVNSHIDEDPRVGYESTPRVARDPECGQEIPNGFFVAINLPEDLDFKSWLLAAPIAAEIKGGLQRGDIQLGLAQTGRVTVVPYFVVKTEQLPDHFHDVALAYAEDKSAEIFDQVPGAEAAQKLGDGRYVFKMNDCPGRRRYCNHGAVVQVTDTNGVLDLSLKILGSPISQISPWIHPTWTQAIDEPYIELKCDGKLERRSLAGSIGFKRKYLYIEPVTAFFMANNSLIAPFERTLKISCPKPEELSFGRESSSVDYLRGSVNLPAKKLTVPF